jgi:hypothetical protein
MLSAVKLIVIVSKIDLPDDLLETVSNVVTPRVVLPATESTSILRRIEKPRIS